MQPLSAGCISPILISFLAFNPDFLYNISVMLLASDFMRLLLVLCILGMALLAAIYLRRREMSIAEYIGWGLLVVLLPLLGPFLVIVYHPGKRVQS